jgi:hypothetical protein
MKQGSVCQQIYTVSGLVHLQNHCSVASATRGGRRGFTLTEELCRLSVASCCSWCLPIESKGAVSCCEATTTVDCSTIYITAIAVGSCVVEDCALLYGKACNHIAVSEAFHEQLASVDKQQLAHLINADSAICEDSCTSCCCVALQCCSY